MLQTLEKNAVAKLVMVQGNLVSDAEVTDILSTYQYVEDGLTPLRFNYQHEDSSIIEISHDLEVIDLFGSSKEHLNNINYILQKIGWIDCELFCESRDIEHMLLGRLVNINITKNEVVGDLATGSDFTIEQEMADVDANTFSSDDLLQMEQPTSSREADEVLHAVNSEFIRTQELTVQLSQAQEDIERVTGLYEAALKRNRDLEALQERNARMPTSALGVDISGLLSFVEKHLNSMMISSQTLDAELIADLRRLGYDVQLKLVRAP